MFMILLLHANFLAFDFTTDYSVVSFFRCLAEAFTLTPVNIFVLITGFFGTSFSSRKVLSLVFQVFFCVVPISLLFLALGVIDFDYHDFVFHKYWFINSYLGLLVLTPVLNAAVDIFSKKDFTWFLSIFYVVIFLSFRFGLEGIQIEEGYSLIWFIFLYLLGRYLRLYSPALSRVQLIAILLVSCLCKTLYIFIFHECGYVDPFIVIQSVSTLLLFSKFDIKSNFINSVAASTTMVYLINLHPVIWPMIKTCLWTLYQSYDMAIFLVLTILLCAVIFIIAIVYDKLRIYAWKLISSHVSEDYDIRF